MWKSNLQAERTLRGLGASWHAVWNCGQTQIDEADVTLAEVARANAPNRSDKKTEIVFIAPAERERFERMRRGEA